MNCTASADSAGKWRTTDVVFIGRCSHADTRLVELLLAIGKAPLGWRGEFTPAFYLECDEPEKLPCGITMYDRGRLDDPEQRQRVLQDARVVLVSGPDSPPPGEVQSCGALPLVDVSSPAANGGFPGAVFFSTAEELLDALYQHLRLSNEQGSLSLAVQLQSQTWQLQAPPRILYLAFVDESFPQLLNKIDQQYIYIKRLAPGSRGVVIGHHFDNLDKSRLAIACCQTSIKPGEEGLREELFRCAAAEVEQFQPDVIYFRDPFFDLLALEFVQRYPNVVFEIQSIVENEVSPMEAFIERTVAPRILAHAAGVVAVTDEILAYQRNRCPRPLAGHVMPNGIAPDAVPFLAARHHADQVHLLCAAHFSPWHGIDRLLQGMASYRGQLPVILHLAGEGSELPAYVELCARLGLEDRVVFHGRLNRSDLDLLASQCQVAVGSLGLHRIGLNQFCILKNREYCLQGLPFIYAGQDVDFSPELPFVEVFPADDSPIEIERVVRLAQRTVANPQLRLQERNYALQHLTWERRINGLVSFLGNVHRYLQEKVGDEVKVRSCAKILLTMYGWNESGGGTTFPRAVALELVKRGHEVTVFYASLKQDPLQPSYAIENRVEDGVTLYGVYNRPALFTDPDHPEREICDDQVVARFRQVLDEVLPDLVHFNNFHGLTFALAEETSRRAIPSCFTPHNYHLIDPELYLYHRDLSRWDGIDLLRNSEAVLRNPEKCALYEKRVTVTRKVLNEWVQLTLAVSNRQRELFIQHGGDPERIVVVHQANSSTDCLWENERLARETVRDVHTPLHVGYIGGVMPQKGVHLLVAAAQAFEPDAVRFHVYGFVTPEYRVFLENLDRKKMVTFHGAYDQGQLEQIAEHLDLAVVPSVWEDCAPLVVLELHAMRLPVIGARIGGIPDFISEGVDGLLYDSADPKTLVAALKFICRQPAVLRGMRENLRQPVHSFVGYMDHLEKIYQALLRGDESEPSSLCLEIRPRINRS